MLNIKIYRDGYVQIGDDIKIYFNGGERNFLKVGIEAPKEMKIVRYEPDKDIHTEEKPVVAGKKGNKFFIING